MTNTRNRIVLAIVGALASFTASAELRYVGSDTVEPLFEAAKVAYQRTNPAYRLTMSANGSASGLRELCGNRAVLAGASRQIKPAESKECVAGGVAATEVPVAIDAVVLVMSNKTPAIASLTIDEVKRIFAPASAGTLVKWRQLRADLPDLALATSGVDIKHGTFEFFHTAIGNDKFTRSDIKSTTHHQDTAKYVAATPGAIGYVSMAEATDFADRLRIVPINFGKGPVAADANSVRSGAYGPLSRTVYVYANGAALAKSEADLSFVKFALAGADKFASFAGLVPLAPMQYQENAARIAALK